MMTETQPRWRKIDIVILAVILAFGIFWRLPSTLFSTESTPLTWLAPVHLNAKFAGPGFDERLYRNYVDDLIRGGITSYPDVAEHYVALQRQLPSAILPPTRFLYIFAAYLWHLTWGTDALTSLHAVSSMFSTLLLLLAAAFAWRLGGLRLALCVTALMSCAPTQIHMSQHALIDGFFAFWATLCLWLLWENLRRPNDWRWLAPYTLALALMVLTKENAMFAYVGFLALLATNRWLRFGQATRVLWLLTFVGPLIGVAVLVNLCGSLGTTYQTYLLLTSKASVLPFAIKTGDGPWYRYLVEVMLMSPIILILAIGTVFRLDRTKRPELFMSIFIATTYLIMCNVRYGMNLRYTNMWDMPLRYLAAICLTSVSATFGKLAQWWLAAFVAAVCLLELHQYVVFFVDHDLYELVTEGLLRAINILK